MIVLEEIIQHTVILFRSNDNIIDDYGKIIVYEHELIPSNSIKRLYLVSGVSAGRSRGRHSHKSLHQLLISINGSILIEVDNGIKKKSVTLDSQSKALYIGPNIWRTIQWNDDSAILVVLASEVYDEFDYIREYNIFLNGVKLNEDDTI